MHLFNKLYFTSTLTMTSRENSAYSMFVCTNIRIEVNGLRVSRYPFLLAWFHGPHNILRPCNQLNAKYVNMEKQALLSIDVITKVTEYHQQNETNIKDIRMTAAISVLTKKLHFNACKEKIIIKNIMLIFTKRITTI